MSRYRLHFHADVHFDTSAVFPDGLPDGRTEPSGRDFQEVFDQYRNFASFMDDWDLGSSVWGELVDQRTGQRVVSIECDSFTVLLEANQ